MKRHYSHFLILLTASLMICCGSSDIESEGSQGQADTTVERGMSMGESENFITTLETLDQNDEVRSEFGTEIVKIRVSIMNKTDLRQRLRFRNSNHKAKIEIYHDRSLVWTSEDLMGLQLIEERELEPQDRLEFVLNWNLLDRASNIVSPGKYYILTKVMSEEIVPSPGVVELEVR